jgi:hypothetical protein
MRRLAYLALAAGACTMSKDDRPKTVQYVTEAILAPTCGAAPCHATFAGNDSDVFDTVIGVRTSLLRNQLIQFDSNQYDPANPSQANLIIWVTQTDPFGRGIGRMPDDRPMPFEDVELLENWIAAGAFGAQCDPEANAGTPQVGLNCKGDVVYSCDSDWNFATPQMDCAANQKSCLAGVCQ